MAVIVPLTSAPNQSIRVGLPINGKVLTLNLTVYFNRIAGFWVMDIADQFGNALVTSLPMLAGVWPAANILAPFEYLAIGAAFLISQNGASGSGPDDTNLGADYVLLWDSN